MNFAAGTAAFQASNVDVEDYHDVVNALMDGPEVDAEVSWDIRWSHPMGRTNIRDAQNGFVGWVAVGGMGTHTVVGGLSASSFRSRRAFHAG